MGERNYVQQVAAEVRAEMARQDKSVDELAEVLGVKTRPTARLRLDGTTAFDTAELWAIATWLGVDVRKLTSTPVGQVAV